MTNTNEAKSFYKQVSRVVTATLEFDQALAEFVSLMCEVTGADYASVVLVDEKGKTSQGTLPSPLPSPGGGSPDPS